MYDLHWSKKELNRQKIGKFGEYYAKMVLTSYGLSVYSSEVDDHGIDFVAETKNHCFYRFQVKTVRGTSGYVFMRENSQTEPREVVFSRDDASLFVVLVLLEDEKEPSVYLIPATAWQNKENRTLVYRTYSSNPEYGINISKKNIEFLEQSFPLKKTIDNLMTN